MAGADLVGATLGSYRITGKLGEGGMGAVYVAEHALLGRKAAVKVLLPEHSKNQDLVTRFFNEAKTAANLRHPAIVEIYDFGLHTDGSAFIAMELLEGESLAKRLESGALPTDKAADIARQIAGGMAAAHAHGIVHRDLKPDNVVLIADAEDAARERVKILDFGIAKLMTPEPGSSKATRTGMVLGTPLFMSPEQCKGAGTVDHRADIYSLGCIFYMMLVGQPPFPLEGVGELIGAHLYEPVKPMRTVNPSVSEALDAVVCKALAKNPDERFQSMGAFAGEIVAAVGLRVTAPGAAARTAVASTLPGAGPAARVTAAPTTLGGSAGERTAPVTMAPAGRTGGSKAPSFVVGGAIVVGAVVVGIVVGRSEAPRGGGSSSAAAPSPGVNAAAPTPSAPVPSVPAAKLTAIPASAPAANNPVPTPVANPPVPTPAPHAPEPSVAPTTADREPAPSARAPKGEHHGSAKPSGRDELYERGVAQLGKGDEVGALQSLRGFLRGDHPPPAMRADAERQVIALQRRLGEVEIVCDVSGAQVSVDGHAAGRTPLPDNIIVRPGAHELVVQMPGYDTIRRTFNVAAGEHKPFVFKRPR